MGAGSKAWLNRHVRDHFVRQARREGLQSRAAFKLKEILARHKLFGPRSVVIDCGAAPGGWTQVATEITKSPNYGLVIAVDLLPLSCPIPNAMFLQRDFTLPTTCHSICDILTRFHTRTQLSPLTEVTNHASISSLPELKSLPSSSLPPPYRIVDAVLCDMAPSFSGIKSMDRLRTVLLAESALELADIVLKPGGNFVCKILQGPETDQLRQRLRSCFHRVMYEKPKSSRNESAEGFLVALGYQDNNKLEETHE